MIVSLDIFSCPGLWRFTSLLSLRSVDTTDGHLLNIGADVQLAIPGVHRKDSSNAVLLFIHISAEIRDRKTVQIVLYNLSVIQESIKAFVSKSVTHY